jgi:hypothetical protein
MKSTPGGDDRGNGFQTRVVSYIVGLIEFSLVGKCREVFPNLRSELVSIAHRYTSPGAIYTPTYSSVLLVRDVLKINKNF